MIRNVEVKNLGPVKRWKANFSGLNFFIGPNASGKSWVNMALYIMVTASKADIDEKLRSIFPVKKLKDIVSWGAEEAEVNVDDIVKLKIKGEEVYFSKDLDLRWDTNFISMPHQTPASIDFLTRLSETEYPKIHEVVWKNIVTGVEEKIGTKFSIKRNRMVASFNGHELDINYVAGGYKTFSLIYLALKRGIITPGGLVFIENPEEHLHPEWQVTMAEVLAEMALKNVQLFVTTHSDYLIKKVNNLMQKIPELKEKVAAYLFTSNGHPQRLVVDKRGIDLLPLIETFYKLYEEELHLVMEGA